MAGEDFEVFIMHSIIPILTKLLKRLKEDTGKRIISWVPL